MRLVFLLADACARNAPGDRNSGARPTCGFENAVLSAEVRRSRQEPALPERERTIFKPFPSLGPGAEPGALKFSPSSPAQTSRAEQTRLRETA